MPDTDKIKLTVNTTVNDLRFEVVGSADPVDSSSGHYIGQMCHDHVLAEVYLQFADDGVLVAVHTLDIGSC